jgi:hypothetical protein
MADQRDTRGVAPHEGEPTAPTEAPHLKKTLQGMEQELRRHSALEDLGPLFGREAQGKGQS